MAKFKVENAGALRNEIIDFCKNKNVKIFNQFVHYENVDYDIVELDDLFVTRMIVDGFDKFLYLERIS